MNATERLVSELEFIRNEHPDTPVAKLATDILGRELYKMPEVIPRTHHILLEMFVCNFLEMDLVGVQNMGDMLELLRELDVDGMDHVYLTLVKCYRLVQLVLEIVWEKRRAHLENMYTLHPHKEK